MQALETWITAVLQVGARVAGLMMFAPFFSHAAIPARVKSGLVVLLTVVLYPVSGVHVASLGAGQAAAMLLQATLVGFLIGLSAMLTFEAAQFAGQLLGIQVGLSLVTVMDPQTQADSPVLATFLQTLVLLLFLGMNVHHWLLRALADSFRFLPANGYGIRGMLVEDILRSAKVIWILGIEIAAPVLAVTLLADVVVAFLGKASPQMPVILVGMPAKNTLGLAALFSAIRFWPAIFDRQFALALSTGERWLHLAR